MNQTEYDVYCRFEAIGLKKVKAVSFDEALGLAEKEDLPFVQNSIKAIGSCRADTEMSLRASYDSSVRLDGDEDHKEYASWGSE